MSKLIRSILLTLMVAASLNCRSAEADHSGDAAENTERAPVPVVASRGAAADKLVVTQHSIELAGNVLRYTVTTGYMPIVDEAGKLQANIFFVAYTKDSSANIAARPVTFAFNGGPGASSMWLHLGVGPKRAELDGDGTVLPSAPRLVDNESTWLGFTDLVFIDPVGTGYSRAGDGIDPKQFYDTARDVQIAGGFIRRYVTKYERWLSPKLILGESYGTTRAAALANHLQETTGLNVNGVILVSSALNFETFLFDAGNDLADVLALPSYTATAWYHKKLDAALQGDLAETLKLAEDWALTKYIVALAKGDALSQAERDLVAGQLARYTGLDKDYLERRNLRIGASRFGMQLLRRENRALGRLDGRVTSATVERTAEYASSDPALFLVTGPLVATLQNYLRNELKYESQLRYEYLSNDVNRSWKWLSGGQGYVYVADELTEAMARDNKLKVFAAAGYYDLATPYLAQKYTFDHLHLGSELARNLTFKSYPAGHQIYTQAQSREQLKSDVEAFVSSIVNAK